MYKTGILLLLPIEIYERLTDQSIKTETTKAKMIRGIIESNIDKRFKIVSNNGIKTEKYYLALDKSLLYKIKEISYKKKCMPMQVVISILISYHKRVPLDKVARPVDDNIRTMTVKKPRAPRRINPEEPPRRNRGRPPIDEPRPRRRTAVMQEAS